MSSLSWTNSDPTLAHENSVSAEIHRAILDPRQSKWWLSGSLQVSLLLRKVFCLYNRHPSVAAGCFWFSCDFLYSHQSTASREMRIICTNAGLKQSTYFFIPLGYTSMSRSRDWSNIGDAKERTAFRSLDNPLPSILIMELVSIVAMCHNNVAVRTEVSWSGEVKWVNWGHRDWRQPELQWSWTGGVCSPEMYRSGKEQS